MVFYSRIFPTVTMRKFCQIKYQLIGFVKMANQVNKFRDSSSKEKKLLFFTKSLCIRFNNYNFYNAQYNVGANF